VLRKQYQFSRTVAGTFALRSENVMELSLSIRNTNRRTMVVGKMRNAGPCKKKAESGNTYKNIAT